MKERERVLDTLVFFTLFSMVFEEVLLPESSKTETVSFPFLSLFPKRHGIE